MHLKLDVDVFQSRGIYRGQGLAQARVCTETRTGKRGRKHGRCAVALVKGGRGTPANKRKQAVLKAVSRLLGKR